MLLPQLSGLFPHLHRAGKGPQGGFHLWCGQMPEAQEDQIEQDREEGEHDGLDRGNEVEAEVVELEQHGMEHRNQRDPFQQVGPKRCFLEPVESHRREHENHECGH